eukprot:Seg1702.9 transcript_id=Seg1702.9/GoldUCD/mRNA.D3Y31 product="G2/M phase-specific E3 ubiquitin-protein ligase" protein_id=Seg1702.9/GoldUCD/D3Y31
MIVRLFEEGDDVDYGRKPSSDTFALSQNEFYHAGEFMAMSVMHGGPAPNFLAKWVFKMICDGEKSALKERVKIPLNHKWKSVVDKIQAATTDDELQTVLGEDVVFDVLSDIGYTGNVIRETLKNKEHILNAIHFKAVVEPILPMINQLKKGLQLFNLLDVIKDHPNHLSLVFTPNSAFKVSPADFIDSLNVQYSEDGTNAKSLEVETFKVFTDFLEMVEHDESNEIGVEDLYMLITGLKSVPPLGMAQCITVAFKHGCEPGCACRPTASTCALTLFLPVHIQSVQDVCEKIKSAVTEGRGFGFV